MATVDLKDLRLYQAAMRLGEEIWKLVQGWDSFARESIGLQLVRSADSIAANISEGYGRYSFKENARFCHFARGSLRETETWITKAAQRSIIDSGIATSILADLDDLRRSLDRYIRSIGHTGDAASEVREDSIPYAPATDFPARRELLSQS